MNFPRHVSLTLTNACNLKCLMCGQWSPNGYMRAKKAGRPPLMSLCDWKRVIDELAEHSIGAVLLRGGELFLFPHIIELMEYIAAKQMFICVDTNGTLLEQYAADLVRFDKLHLTISIDGPKSIHDKIRGMPGCFEKIRRGVQSLNRLQLQAGGFISKSINFTIMPESVSGLSQMPEIARLLGIDTICIVPYYYISEQMGKDYDRAMQTQFGCSAFSWRGFHREHSGIVSGLFSREHQKYLQNLKGLRNFPYMDFSAQQYDDWFRDGSSQVGSADCQNVESLIDIQPSGQANFCVDFPDYSFGNVTQSTIEKLWNSPEAERFRQFRRRRPLPVCMRCGAKYMALIEG